MGRGEVKGSRSRVQILNGLVHYFTVDNLLTPSFNLHVNEYSDTHTCFLVTTKRYWYSIVYTRGLVISDVGSWVFLPHFIFEYVKCKPRIKQIISFFIFFTRNGNASIRTPNEMAYNNMSSIFQNQNGSLTFICWTKHQEEMY